MKTAELREMSTHALQEKSWGSTYPVLVLEKVLWTEKNEWFPKADGSGREERRVLCRAEKGARAGTGGVGYRSGYRKTGIPVLKLCAPDYSFKSSADPEYCIGDTAEDLLTRAMEKIQILDLVDSEQSVFTTDTERGSRRKTQTTVMAQYADGHTGEVAVELELVRPQAILSDWTEHLEAAEKEAVAKAELEREKAERKAKNDKTAWSIRDRVTALLDDADTQRYNSHDERYDLHRQWIGGGLSTKYEVSEGMLLKLLELAEKGSAK
jgi:hypothetical protein